MAVMMNPREKWTDERLDDLSTKVDQGFANLRVEMKEGFDRLDGRSEDRFKDVDRRFKSVDRRFKDVDRRFDEVNGRLQGVESGLLELNRTLTVGLFAVIATLIGSNFF